MENFPSVAHYYVHAMKQLDAHVDLFASLSSRFGLEHALVKKMMSVLRRQSNMTFITREPTVVTEERHREGSAIPVPGLQQFSDECRSLSWVVRTGPLTYPARDVRSRGRLEPIAGSIGGCSYHTAASRFPKHQEAQIVCPGLPVSFDGYEQPAPPPRIATQPPKRNSTSKKKPLLNRIMSCLCFAS